MRKGQKVHGEQNSDVDFLLAELTNTSFWMSSNPQYH